jgi:hypothetical protein
MKDIPTMIEEMLKLPEDELAQMNHGDLLLARAGADRKDKTAQNKLSAAEHRAFAREYTADNPAAAIPLALMTLLYQPYKMLKGTSRSDASMDQAMSGLIGVKEGIGKALKDL